MSITGSTTLITILTVGPASGKKATSGTAPGQDGIPVNDYSQYNQDLLSDIIGQTHATVCLPY